MAVLQKTRLLPWEASAKVEKKTSENGSGEKQKEPPRKKRRMHGFREDPFVFFEDDEPVWPEIRYEISTFNNTNCFFYSYWRINIYFMQ